MDLKVVKKKIEQLKTECNAIILAHNYQRPEVQDIADFVGDSFGLAVHAEKVDADIIIFCGVDFMAETAKILNPTKIVIHPNKESKCPMAAMVDVKSLEWMKQDHPEAAAVAYVNTTAEVKAACDICCTSSNAVKVINSLHEDEVIFVPDRNLGKYVQRFIGDKNMILWPGICPTHHKIEVTDIKRLQELHSHAEVMVHPECRPELIDLADRVFSTQGMINYAIETKVPEFIVGTERELCHRLSKLCPDKTFHCVEKAVCPNMKKITLENILTSIHRLKPQIELSYEIIQKSYRPLEKMVNIGRGD